MVDCDCDNSANHDDDVNGKNYESILVDHIDQFYPEVPLVIRFIFLTMTVTNDHEAGGSSDYYCNGNGFIW